ncbi:hypothetical protein HAX54_042248, partial [Datura stramonium]|nr:hypothetical protein [Datura stramonium]
MAKSKLAYGAKMASSCSGSCFSPGNRYTELSNLIPHHDIDLRTFLKLLFALVTSLQDASEGLLYRLPEDEYHRLANATIHDLLDKLE